MKQPFFVVGTGRSGSTYLFRMLADHPRIALTNEGHIGDFLSFCSRYASVPAYEPVDMIYFEEVTLHGMIMKRYADRFATLFRRHSVQILEEFYNEEFADKDFTHWGDKLPSSETGIELQSVYPHAKYLVLMRDPRDYCCSMLSYREREDIKKFNPRLLTQTVEDWSIDWNNSYKGFETYLTHKHLVSYEKLVDDPVRELTAMLAFLDLEGAGSILERAAERDTLQGHATTRDPKASIGRWERDLEPADLQTIESVCGETMSRYGYALSGR